MVKVYFETQGYAEPVAIFDTEDTYDRCFGELEKMATEGHFPLITESVEENIPIREVFDMVKEDTLKSSALLKSIDYALLKQQKSILIDLIYEPETITTKKRKELEGLLCLLDSIQDHAVDVLGFSPKIVFK